MILLHHLRVGRSIFTVWLLEELGADYEMKIYNRLETGRAPPELKAAHPLGKSPVIEADMGAERVTLAESGAIAAYLVETLDKANTFSPPRSDEAAYAKWLQWLHYPEGSAFLPLMLQYIQIMMNGGTPPQPDAITAFSQGEIDLHLAYIKDALGGHDYILGSAFQAPDVGLAFILQMAEGLGKLTAYPALQSYLDRCRARPAFAAAMEKAGG